MRCVGSGVRWPRASSALCADRVQRRSLRYNMHSTTPTPQPQRPAPACISPPLAAMSSGPWQPSRILAKPACLHFHFHVCFGPTLFPHTYFAISLTHSNPRAPRAPQVWSSRPLTPELLSYASTDVRYLHALADALLPRLGRDLYDTVRFPVPACRTTVRPLLAVSFVTFL